MKQKCIEAAVPDSGTAACCPDSDRNSKTILPSMTREKIWFLLVCLALLVMMLGLVFHYSRQKAFFHVDESYSYHFVCRTDYPSVNQDRPGLPFLDTWHDASYYYDYFVVDDTERFDIRGVVSSIKKDQHPPLHYILLELTFSLFSVNRFTKWTGLGLNFALYVFHLFVLFVFSKRLLKSEKWALLACVLYGTSLAAMSTVLFIRMYMLFTALSTLLLYGHLRLFEMLERGQSPAKALFAIVVTGVLGMLTHYLFFMFFAVVASVFASYLLVSRKYDRFMAYSVVVLASLGLFLLLWPEFLNDFFKGFQCKEAFHNLTHVTHVGYLHRIGIFSDYLFTKLLGKGIINFVLTGLFLVVAVAAYFGKHKGKQKTKDAPGHKLAMMFGVVVLIHLILVSKTAPENLLSPRYIFNLFPICSMLLVYLIKALLGKQSPSYLKIIVGCLIVANAIASHFTGEIKYLNNKQTVCYPIQYPIVLVTKNNARMVTAESSFYFKDAKGIYVTTFDGIGTIPQAIQEVSSDYYVIAIQKDDREDAVLSQLESMMDVKEKQLLGKTGSTKVYLMPVMSE